MAENIKILRERLTLEKQIKEAKAKAAADGSKFSDAEIKSLREKEARVRAIKKIEVIQGGLGFKNHPMRLKPIVHESTNISGLRHLIGSISMARIEPGSASSEVFICISDQPELDYGGKRNPDGQGFAVFGRVIEGLDIIKRIHNQENEYQLLKKPIFINFIN